MDEASEEETQQSLKELVNRVTTSFLVPPEETDLFASFNNCTNFLRSPVQEIAEAFRANILGLVTMVSFPYTLAHTATIDKHYQRIISAERIRSLKLGKMPSESEADLDERRKAISYQLANERMEEFVKSSEGANSIIRGSLLFLEQSRNDNALSDSANELILQGVVLCWGALEVLIRDAFIILLNLDPNLIDNLVNDPIAKRRFDLGKIPIEILSQHDFNLSGKMGDVLSQQQDLSDLQSIKAVYGAIFPRDEQLRNSLSDEGLRILSQRRNLIVHRRGLIDDLYVKSVGGNQNARERLKILPDELEKDIHCSVVAASAVLMAVNSHIEKK